jgi:hypothetical protein
VLRVHHAGHGNQERARGHSSLPAGVDTEIRVGDGEVSLTKQRDETKNRRHLFALPVVTVGQDADGEPITTCVVKQVELNALDPALNEPMEEMWQGLREKFQHGDTVTQNDIRVATPDMTPQQRKTVTDALVTKRYLRREGKDYIISEPGADEVFR